MLFFNIVIFCSTYNFTLSKWHSIRYSFGIKFKLRFFVPLSFLLYANLSLALGLGEAQLKSNLGERLLATVEVIDLEHSADSSCFSAQDTGDVPAFKKAKVSLKQISNKHQLIITSSEVISEPIVNLNVTFHCDPNLGREYVLLLDPAPLVSTENNSTAGSTADNALVNAATSPAIDKPNLQENINNSKKATKKKRAKKLADNAVSAIDKQLLEAYTGKQYAGSASGANNSPSETTLTANKNTKPDVKKSSTDKPFLVISGGNASSSDNANNQNLSLRLATEIDFSRPDAELAPTAATDALDEVTVMANRLSHLEKQIATLQTRNAQLLSEAAKAKTENAKTDWLLIAEIGLGLLLSLLIAEFLRRKLANRESNSQDSWFETKRLDAEMSSVSANESKLFSNPATIFPEHETEDASAFSNASYSVSSSQSHTIASKVSTPENDNHGSIIDDADVFIEHGRPALAIQLLQNHLSESPAESPAVWLKLLNLISKEGTESEYDAAVVECNKHFNIKAAKYGSTTENDDSSIEDYPHIITRLEGVWGSPYAVGFLNDLINNKRSQPREGLNQGAFEDLFFLKNIAKSLEYANPSVYKSTSDAPVATNAAIANSVFNDALFSEIEPASEETARTELGAIEPASESKSAPLEFEVAPKLESFDASNSPTTGEKVSANLSFDIESAPYLGDSAYEVSMIEDEDNVAPAFDLQPAEAAISKTGFDDTFKAQEIDFSIPTEKVEYATTTKATDKNIALEFSLDFPLEASANESANENLAKSKAKAKTKTKSSTGKAAESNEIAWDLPEIDPKK